MFLILRNKKYIERSLREDQIGTLYIILYHINFAVI